MEVLAVEVETEGEERTALLLGCGQRGDVSGPRGGEAQAEPVRDLLAYGAAEELVPLGGALAEPVAGQRAGDRRGAPGLGVLRGLAAWREHDVHRLAAPMNARRSTASSPYTRYPEAVRSAGTTGRSSATSSAVRTRR
ncbi:hypothetical protein [Streptomyces sp. NPDC057429]|uniref:hypothetical protein n=1 Tax=Streptomyces sp. NPDC057429 TaxID=3346130 RepID=UPI00369F7BF3